MLMPGFHWILDGMKKYKRIKETEDCINEFGMEGMGRGGCEY